MIQIRCRCGREMQLIHPPESGVVICSGCLTEVSVPGKLARRRVRDPVRRNEEWLTCRKCRNSFPWPTRYVGRMTRCPVCGKQVRMPNYRRKFRWGGEGHYQAYYDFPSWSDLTSDWSRWYPGLNKKILLPVVIFGICFLVFIFFLSVR